MLNPEGVLSVSYNAAKNASAASPPLHTVPGQSDGEKRNEQLAVTRQPRARPALLWLRRVEGWENRIAIAIEATARMMSKRDIDESRGGTKVNVDARTVSKADPIPPRSVMSTLIGELISEDDMEAVGLLDLDRDHTVDADVGENVAARGLAVEVDARDGRGGGRASIEAASAR